MKKNNLQAVIFDMDGVIVDNTDFHVLNWVRFVTGLGFKISERTVRREYMGRLAREILSELLHKNITQKEIEKIDAKREAYYRKIYAAHIKPLPGLINFLNHLKEGNIKIALATSAPTQNVRFVLQKTGIKKFFKVIVDSKGVKRGKPNPDIFLKAAKKLRVIPKHAVVFEDTFHGIEAAKRAKMKVVGVATSHKPKEISHADLVVKDFKGVTLTKLESLM